MSSPTDLALYSYDGALDRGKPEAVVLARDGEDVRRAVEFCSNHGIPFTARGAGTNLSGGCIPLRGGVIVSLARMNKILSIDPERGVAVVEPGVINGDLQKVLEKNGYFYAPDPASLRVSTIGGNIAENAGGPRCLKYGVTTGHVLAVEAVMPDGSIARFSLSDQGYEMTSLLVGAEGTLGIVTKAWLKILPRPEKILTFLCGFDSIEAAVKCVSAIIARGVLPRVLEAMDRTTVESVESYRKVGYPRSEAVLLIESDGAPEQVEREAVEIEKICREHGGSDWRQASDADARERLWEGRRGAYAAMARLKPNVLVEDGVVPRDKLPLIVDRIKEIAARHRVMVALLFHAGDGNIHPNIGYDERNVEETARVKAAGHEILQACVELGGSLSGEHGIGADKRDAMGWLFTPETLGLYRRIKEALDPGNISNPDKVIPLEKSAGYPYRRPPAIELGEQARHLVDKVKECAKDSRAMAILGSASRLQRPLGDEVPLLTTGLNRILDLDRSNQTVSVEAGISVHALSLELESSGFHLRLPETGGTVGGLLAVKAFGGARDEILGMRLLLADGNVAELGGKVVKNVAGYDVPRLVLGSWGTLGVILEVTFKIYSCRQSRARPDGALAPFAAGPWQRKIKRAFDPMGLLNPWFFA